jgi:uncharacterized protein (TIGR03435 family)
VIVVPQAFGIALLCACVVAGQNAPAFEVASIRENRSVGGRTLMDGSGGRYTVINATLRMLILNAFHLQDAQLIGGPGWINDTRYDVIGIRGAAQVDQIQAMMRTLLADRFKLKTHPEKREMAMYALVTVRTDRQLGPRMTAAKCEGRELSLQPGKSLPCNTRFVGPGRLRAGGTNMLDFAALLTTLVDRIVIDQTELAGAYDLEMTWTPDRSQQERGRDDFLPPVDSDAPALFTAIQEQLGLKLQGGRRSVDVVVIDSVERPSEN